MNGGTKYILYIMHYNNLYKLQIIYPNQFLVNEYVTIKIIEGNKVVHNLLYRIEVFVNKDGICKFFLNLTGYANALVFALLGLDKAEFCYKLLDMKEVQGDWPETSSLSELRHMLEVLESLNEF